MIREINLSTKIETTRPDDRPMPSGAEALAMEAEFVRQHRNSLLAETDYVGLTDYLATVEELAYRQSLRDLTQQAGFPTGITWPTKPD